MRRSHAPVLAVALLLVALASGPLACFSVGREFPVDPVGTLRIGDTTRDDVRLAFGPPWRTGIDDGLRTWTYGHYRYSVFGPTRTRDLVVRFDEQGRLASYTFNSTYPEDRDL